MSWSKNKPTKFPDKGTKRGKQSLEQQFPDGRYNPAGWCWGSFPGSLGRCWGWSRGSPWVCSGWHSSGLCVQPSSAPVTQGLCALELVTHTENEKGDDHSSCQVIPRKSKHEQWSCYNSTERCHLLQELRGERQHVTHCALVEKAFSRHSKSLKKTLNSVTQCKSGEMQVELLLFTHTKTSCPRLQLHLSNTLYSPQACRLGNKTGSEEPSSLFEIYFTDLWNAFFWIKSIAAWKEKTSMPLEEAFCQLEAKTWVWVSDQQSRLREQGGHLLPGMPCRAPTPRGASVSSTSQTPPKHKDDQCRGAQTPVSSWRVELSSTFQLVLQKKQLQLHGFH